MDRFERRYKNTTKTKTVDKQQKMDINSMSQLLIVSQMI